MMFQTTPFFFNGSIWDMLDFFFFGGVVRNKLEPFKFGGTN